LQAWSGEIIKIQFTPKFQSLITGARFTRKYYFKMSCLVYSFSELLKHTSRYHHPLSQNQMFKLHSEKLWLFWQNQTIASNLFYVLSDHS